ncbi:WD40 repeat domain-containing serine/threonine protein kinase [Tengunoibacter tsumagoiensis]|uniref:Protein kinase domain-containing protein n=1 Tax=Tengunoibacter tsumagoiensis TaxID=2014871 RepID=A0A402A3N2_9CHLR|nr:serine/threonine-protein kinase [Tengunoibacter tsumagoiensis]GCE13645.1 hypothetical protein KTT_35040 [Tengunoibacter tsumagoiensis]
MPDRVGQQLGHYHLTRVLGRGGFADVYLGEHIHLGTLAAIKVLDTRLAPEEVEQFRNEARTIARLEHPHIVRVLDFGVSDHVPFLVMSYALHGSLRQRYPRGTRLHLPMIVSYVKQIASALQYAHDEHYIHRDIKPENMLLGTHEEILLSDFGLAVIAQSSAPSGAHDVSGTIMYMAPEQARGRPLPASDQYALGVIVYEWLCGKRPFQGTFEEVAVQHALTEPPPLHDQIPTISPALEAIVLRALQKDPQQRFAQIQDFARLFEQAYLADQRQSEAPSSTTIALLSPSAPEQSFVAERQSAEMIYAVAWSPDRRRIAYGGHDKTVQVRGATTGASTLIYRGHSGGVTMLAWSPSGQQIASASLDRTLQIWNSLTGERLASYDLHTGMVSAVAWSPDGKLLASTSSGTNNTIHLWDATSGREEFVYRGHTSWVRALAWSPQGKYIASGSKNEVQVWEALTGRKLFTHRQHNSWVRALAWSPDGSKLATAGEDHTIHVWEPGNKGHQVMVHRGHTDWIMALAWSPDGNWLASGSKDHIVHAWRVEGSPSTLLSHPAGVSRSYQVHTASTYAITWLSDNKHIVSANGNGMVQVWQVD